MLDQDLASYLPTPERASNEGLELPAGEPRMQRRLVLLVVRAAVMRRFSWTEDSARFRNLPDLEPGVPPIPTDFEARHYMRLDSELSEQQCRTCFDSPGRMRCRVCGGAGKLFGGKHRCSCDKGFVACPTCGGAAIHTRVRVRYFSDDPALVHEAYVPGEVASVPALFGVERAIEDDAALLGDLPEALRCHDLSGRVGGSAYRGGTRTVRPTFHGHDFGDTIDQALAGLQKLSAGAQILRYDIRAYAWPIVWLRYPTQQEIVLYVDQRGTLKAFRG